MNIQSATLVKYNANNRGTRTGDCSARAISLAFNIDYSKARKALNDSAKAHWGWDYNSHENCLKVIKELGGGGLIHNNSKITVNDFVDLHSTGTYIIWCSKDGTVRSSNHLACVIDGKVYDSWDSRIFYVLGYWIIESGVKGSDITDIREYLSTWINSRTSQQYIEYINGIFDDIINKNRQLKKLVDENNIDVQMSIQINKIALVNFTFNFSCVVTLNIDEYGISEKYPHKIAVAFKPTMPSSEVESYWANEFYGKFYCFIRRIIKDVADICASNKLLVHSDRDLPAKERQPYSSWDKLSAKSFKSLPYWVQRLATYFRRKNPFEGEYHDSIELTINTPPFDTKYGERTDNAWDSNTREFHAYNMSDLMRGLKYYQETGDYDKAYGIAADW